VEHRQQRQVAEELRPLPDGVREEHRRHRSRADHDEELRPAAPQHSDEDEGEHRGSHRQPLVHEHRHEDRDGRDRDEDRRQLQHPQKERRDDEDEPLEERQQPDVPRPLEQRGPVEPDVGDEEGDRDDQHEQPAGDRRDPPPVAGVQAALGPPVLIGAEDLQPVPRDPLVRLDDLLPLQHAADRRVDLRQRLVDLQARARGVELEVRDRAEEDHLRQGLRREPAGGGARPGQLPHAVDGEELLRRNDGVPQVIADAHVAVLGELRGQLGGDEAALHHVLEQKLRLVQHRRGALPDEQRDQRLLAQRQDDVLPPAGRAQVAHLLPQRLQALEHEDGGAVVPLDDRRRRAGPLRPLALELAGLLQDREVELGDDGGRLDLPELVAGGVVRPGPGDERRPGEHDQREGEGAVRLQRHLRQPPSQRQPHRSPSSLGGVAPRSKARMMSLTSRWRTTSRSVK